MYNKFSNLWKNKERELRQKKNSFSINTYELKWRKACECELNQIMVDKQLWEQNLWMVLFLDLLTAINRIFVPTTQWSFILF